MKTHIKLLTVVFVFVCNLVLCQEHPFEYDLHLTRFPGKSSEIMIVAHGMGGNYQIAETINIEKTLISFNFPDHDCWYRMMKVEETNFGTIHELLPLLYVIKDCVINKKNPAVDLYGFSAGGGAILNILSVLKTHRFKPNLSPKF